MFLQLSLLVLLGTASFYSLRLVRGQSVAPEPFSPFTVTEIGLFLHVDTPFGLSLQWDHGTRLYVKLSSSLRGQVSIHSHTHTRTYSIPEIFYLLAYLSFSSPLTK